MDNSAFESDEKPKPGVEMQELKDVVVKDNNTNIKVPEHMCKADLCQKVHKDYMDRQQNNANPQDNLKMLFFLGTLGLFVTWLLLYILLNKLEIL